jgi:ATP-dependent Zn protease
VAYHEVGHAMVAYKQKNTEPVQKITIVPHTQGSLGYTLLMPEEDKTELRTRTSCWQRLPSPWAAAPPRKWCCTP